MMPTGHEQWDELAVGRALGALEPEDEQAFAAHVRDCAHCGRMLADMEAVAAQLAYGVEAAEPPPAVLDSIMAEVRGSDAVTVIHDRPPVVTPMRRPSARPRFDRSWLAAAAALVLVVGLAGWNFQLRADNHAKSRALAVREQIGKVALDPGTRTVALKNDSTQRAQVLVQGTKAWLVVDGFDENDTSRQVYVLWKLSGSAATPVRTFDVVHGGLNFISVGDVGDASRIDKFAVSIEPGRNMPTTPPTKVIVSA
jgi:hypothetical protein